MVNAKRHKTKVEKIDQIGIVVKDCEKVAQQWERMLGIGPWTIITQNAKDFEGNPLEVKLAFAYVGDLEFELIEIAEGKIMHSEWLEKHGEGLHHLSFFVDDPDGVAANLVERGAKIMLQRRGQWVYLDCGAGGVIFEPQIKRGKVARR
jgi:hypothetical protein